jgi:cell division protein FtsB
MKIALIISLLCLSGCTPSITGTQDALESLKQENAALQTENANLREENILLRAGGDPSTLQSSFGGDTTYTE